MDICIMQKRMLSAWELALLRRKSALLAYDFDDSVWTEQNDPKPLDCGQHKRRFLRTCRSADVVIAGNAFLAAAVPYGIPVTIAPTPIDVERYVPAPDKIPPGPVIGWMGTASYLPLLHSILDELQRAPDHLSLHIVSNQEPLRIACGHYTFTRWSPENELPLLQHFDIGLMPLEDTPYSSGKGGFKILQYMACGVVPIASAVGVNKEIISHGIDGFLVQPGEPWLPYIRQLHNLDILKTMSCAARNTVCERFAVRIHAASLFLYLSSRYREFGPSRERFMAW
jgi:glycosyltransferase involved in cell wall biosynthesis